MKKHLKREKLVIIVYAFVWGFILRACAVSLKDTRALREIQLEYGHLAKAIKSEFYYSEPLGT